MPELVTLPITRWQHQPSKEEQQLAMGALEHGHVLHLPGLPFALDADEQRLLSPALATSSKNISLDASGMRLGGSAAQGDDARRLQALMARFATCSTELLTRLAPRYEAGLQRGRTSFRPQEIAGRSSSWRKDDTRLHVDSFPSSPTRGRRILRVFANVHPSGQARRWRLGEPFEAVARRYLPTLHRPLPGAAPLMHWLGVTKQRRSDYDHHMLQLHDRMKADLAYQAGAVQTGHEFASGSTWMVFTDQVSHAAMSGQHALEQTYLLDVDAMQDPGCAPLRVLEGMLGRRLV